MRVLTHTRPTLALLLIGAVACGKKEEPPPPDPIPPPPAPLAVESLDLGKAIGSDKKVTNSTDDFGVRDTIYASVGTSGSSSGSTLTAVWTFQTGQVVDSSAQSIAPSGPATTEFHITKGSAWPVGKYKVVILLNGAPAKDKEFEIKR